jgi:hypothetical protein
VEDDEGEKRVEELDFTRFHLHNSWKCVRLPRSPPIFKYGLTSNNISLSDTMSLRPPALLPSMGIFIVPSRTELVVQRDDRFAV